MHGFSQDAQLVAIERADGVLRLTLQNPPANLLSIAVMQSLLAELDASRDDESVRVVVISAAGKLFSAGHDLKEMTAHRSDEDGGKSFFEQTFALCSRPRMQACVGRSAIWRFISENFRNQFQNQAWV